MNTTEYMIITVLALQTVILFLLVFRKTKKPSDDLMIHNIEKLERILRQEFYISRDEFSRQSKDLRNEVLSQFKTFTELISRHFKDMNEMLRVKLDTNTLAVSEVKKTVDQNLERIRETISVQLRNLQEDNSNKLEQMRNTVDEKLQNTLEKRLSDSFKQVSERLELVHKGLGEMQVLATGVGDLKKVLSNVKTRGILGEVQLENILGQILTLDQYVKNVNTRPGCRENVEFDIKLPGKDDGREIFCPLIQSSPWKITTASWMHMIRQIMPTFRRQ